MGPPCGAGAVPLRSAQMIGQHTQNTRVYARTGDWRKGEKQGKSMAGVAPQSCFPYVEKFFRP